MKKLVTTGFVLLGFGLLGLPACSSAPKNAPAISASSDASSEVASTRAELETARKDQYEQLTPENFAKAETKLKAAEKSLADKKSNEKVFEDLSAARGYLQQAHATAATSKSMLAPAMTARANAMAINDSNNKEIKSADDDLKALSKKIEKGDGVEEKKVAAVTGAYIDAERKRVTRTQIDPIESRIDQAKRMDAKRLAPKTYARADQDLIAAKKTVQINPYDRAQVSERIQMAYRSSLELMEVAKETAKTPGASTEDLVLANRQKDRATREQLRSADARFEQAVEGNARVSEENQKLKENNENLNSTVADLKEENQPQVMLKKLRSELPEETADIMMTPSGKVMVRLKHLQFKTNSSDLTPEAASVIASVRSALADINAKKLVVEGHTDSTGSAARNKTLSESRANTVASVLKSEGALAQADIQTKGYGAEQPIKNNQSKEGRAENRRVEITIENN